MSIFSRAEQLFKGTELLSEIPADLDAVSVAQRINELTIQRLSDGGYMFRVANADNSPCAVVSRDGSSIQLYADAARKNDDFLRFLLRTAFECRFCHEGIVSLHAACVELDGFAVAFTGHSGLGKSTRAKAWVDGLAA